MAIRGIITSSDLSKEFPYSRKPIEYGNAKKNLHKLCKLNLLERDHQRTHGISKRNNKRKMRHYYKLSKYGIYNLISNNRNLQFDVAKNLLLNYSNHLLLGFFLFPYIKIETLKSPELDSVIFSEIFSYLHDCCKQLEALIFNIDHAGNQIDGYSTRQLFICENVPQIDVDRENLRNFIKQKFNWNWLNKAEFKKTDDNHITASYGLKSLLIIIDRKRKKAILSFRGRKEYEFIVREFTNGYCVVEVMFKEQVQIPYVKIFLISYATRITKFITSLISHYNPNYLSLFMEILGRDERFRQALKKTECDIVKRCKLIIERKEPKTKAYGNSLLFSSF